ncbi:MAG: preprotein translocase subunit SecE [Pseudomonadota bacterium]
MSRLHKKIPAGEKKKKSEGRSDADSGVAVSNLATTASPLKAKPDKKKADVKTDVKIGEPGFFQKWIEFFREVKVELKKVTWPTKKQTTGTTIVVIIFVFIVSAFLGLFDLGLSKLVQVVLT